MRKGVLLIILFVSTLSVCGQQVFIETGTVISAFDYKNSEGEKLDNLYGGHHLLLQAGYHAAISNSRLNYSFGISYAGYVSSGSDTTLGNFYAWEADYIGTELALEYEIISNNFASSSANNTAVFLKVAISPEILIHGTQTINEQVYSLAGVEQFKHPFLFARGGAGICYSVTRLISIYGEYMAGYGFPVKIGDTDDKEKLGIISHNISFGLFINLPSYESRR